VRRRPGLHAGEEDEVVDLAALRVLRDQGPGPSPPVTARSPLPADLGRVVWQKVGEVAAYSARLSIAVTLLAAVASATWCDI